MLGESVHKSLKGNLCLPKRLTRLAALASLGGAQKHIAYTYPYNATHTLAQSRDIHVHTHTCIEACLFGMAAERQQSNLNTTETNSQEAKTDATPNITQPETPHSARYARLARRITDLLNPTQPKPNSHKT